MVSALMSKSLPVLAALCLTAGAAHAASPRYTTLFDEYVDGQKAPTSSSELEVVRQLSAGGITFVDEAQSRKIRSMTDAGTLMNGSVPEVITSLDADLILAAVTRLEPIKSDLLQGNAFRYDATIDARLVAVDTGQVLNVFFTQGSGLGFSKIDAQRKASMDAAGKLSKELLAAAKKRSSNRRIELTVAGIPNVTAGERVVQGVRDIGFVSDVRVLQAGRGTTKLELKAGSKSARDVALALDSQSGLGITVFGYSDTAIKADYSPEAATTLGVVITPLSSKSGKKGDGWRGPAMSEMLGCSLSNKAFVQLHGDGKAVAMAPQHERWGKKLDAMKVDKVRSLVLTGTFRRDKDDVNVAVKLKSAQTGAVVLAGQRVCPADEVSACVSGLGDELAEKLMPSLLAKRHLFKEVIPTRMTASKGAASSKPLRLGKTQVANLYPARLNAYKDRPVGSLSVTNTGKSPLTDVVVTTALPGFTTGPVDTPVDDIGAGASATLPLKVVLDRKALVGHDQNEAAVLEIVVRYTVDDMQVEERRSQALLVYDRNTLSWGEQESVASFVTPRTAAMQKLARAIAGATPKASANDPISLAAALFVGMGELGLRYQRDPVSPYGAEALDYVQFPEQTLARKSGDCDDLAVLYAALGEAIGIPVALITTPEHVFVGVYTGVPVHNRGVIAAGDNRLVEHEGMMWLPLETTLVGQQIAAAWDKATEELARWSKEEGAVKVIDVRQAWTSFPPVSLVVEGAPAPSLGSADLQARVAKEIDAFGAYRAKTLEVEIGKLDAALRKNPEDGTKRLQMGVLMALSGNKAEAAKVFDSLQRAAQWSKHALNNAGNVHLLDGDSLRAHKSYLGAIRVDDQDARVLINAAVAAHLLKDEEAFGEHIFKAILLGGEELVTRLSRAGIGGGDGTRAADASEAGRDLRAAIKQALKKHKAKMPAGMAADASALKASDAAAPSASIAHHLYWLW